MWNTTSPSSPQPSSWFFWLRCPHKTPSHTNCSLLLPTQQERATVGLSIQLLTIMIAYPFPAPVKFICQPYPYLKHSQSMHFFGIAKGKKSNNTCKLKLRLPAPETWLYGLVGLILVPSGHPHLLRIPAQHMLFSRAQKCQVNSEVHWEVSRELCMVSA